MTSTELDLRSFAAEDFGLDIKLQKLGASYYYKIPHSRALPYINQLLDGVTFYPVEDDSFRPSGSYFSLSVSDWTLFLDFFIDEDYQHIVRYRTDGFKEYVVAVRNDTLFPIGQVVRNWWNDIA